MLTIIKLIRKTFQSLNGDVRPAACAAAVLFGLLAGLTPFGVQTFLYLALLVVFAVPVGLGLAVAAIAKLLYVVILPAIGAPLGQMLLQEGWPSRKLVVLLLEIPVVGLVPLERHAVLGGAVLALAAGLLLWFPVLLGVRSYRASLREKLTQAGWYQKAGRFVLGQPRQHEEGWKPPGIVRWKLLAAVVVIFGSGLWIGAPAMVDRALSESLRDKLQEDVEIGSVDCSIFGGRIDIRDLQVGGFNPGTQPMVAADRFLADVSILDLLRRRAVVENLVVDRPRANLETDDQGNLLVLKRQEQKDRQDGLDVGAIWKRARELYGDARGARDWIQRVREVVAYFQARKEVVDPELARALRGETELPERGPSLVLQNFSISGLALAIAGDAGPPLLRDFRFAGQQISNDPIRLAAPLAFMTAGLMGADDPATMLVQTTSDGGDGETLRLNVRAAEIANLQASAVKPLVGATLPFDLQGGTIALALRDGWVESDGTCNLQASLILRNLKVAPAAGFTSLAGYPAADICRAISDAGTFGLDVRLTGDLMDPKVDVGNMPELLMTMGAQAFARLAEQQLVERFGPGMGQILGGDGPLALPGLLTGNGPAGQDLAGTLLDLPGLLGQAGGAAPGNPLQGLFEGLGQGTQGAAGIGNIFGGLGSGEAAGEGQEPGNPLDAIKRGLGGILPPGQKPGDPEKPGEKQPDNPLDAIKQGLGGLLPPQKKPEPDKPAPPGGGGRD